MRGPCIQAVRGAIGRDITQAESRGIEHRIRDHMRSLAKEDPTRWSSISPGQRLQEAAARAADELKQEATLKKVRIAQTIVAHDRVENYTQTQFAEGLDETRLDALDRMLVGKNDGKNNIQSVEAQVEGQVSFAMSRLVDTWQTISPKFMGLFKNKTAEDALYLALRGDTNVGKEFQRAAKIFQDEVAEPFRQRYNAAGGNVGKRSDWGAPQSHSDTLFIKAGREQVINDYFSAIKRDEYVHEDGRIYSDAEIRAMLDDFYTTVVTDGANKQRRSDMIGGSVKANRHSHERQIHFKDPQTALEIFRKYSDKNLFQVLSDHVRGMARDIALTETFGPNSDLAMRHFAEKFTGEAIKNDPGNKGKYIDKARDIIHLYNYLAGNTTPPANRTFANIAQGTRDVISSAILGSVPIASIGDWGTMYRTASVNQLPMHRVFLNEVRSYNPLNRKELKNRYKAGLMVDAMIDQVNRFGIEGQGPRWSSKMSNLFYGLTGQNKWDGVKRGAIRTTMLNDIGHLTREFESFDRISADDHAMLKQAGITQKDWDIWRKAEPEKWRGNDTVLTPDAIWQVKGVSEREKLQAITKLMGFVNEQGNIGIIQTSARQRAVVTQGTEGGTVKGELIRSIAMLKSFPLTYFDRFLKEAVGRYENMPGKIGYVATTIAIQTILGAIALEVNDIISGRDPRSLHPNSKYALRNWLAAAAKGGGLGPYGDFLFAETSSAGRGFTSMISGPALGLIESTDDLTRGNILQALRGEETHFGAEATKYVRNLTPGHNLWYAKAVLDHEIFNQLQEYFNPGYLQRVKNRSQNLYGTRYWWNPESELPHREPNLQNIGSDKR